MCRPSASGSSTPTHSLNEGSSDGLESDQLSEVRSIKSQPSTSKDIEYDPIQANDFPPLQNRSVRNPMSVVHRLTNLMANRNNVSYLKKKNSSGIVESFFTSAELAIMNHNY